MVGSTKPHRSSPKLSPTMGAAGSVPGSPRSRAAGDEPLWAGVLRGEATRPLDASDLADGVAAKAEVVRLRQLLHAQMQVMAGATRAAAAADMPPVAAVVDAEPVETTKIEKTETEDGDCKTVNQ